MAYKRIGVIEAKKILEDKNAIIVDIRDTESYNKGHAATAIHLTQDNLKDFIQSTDKHTPLLVMCYHGNSSQMIGQYLSQEGFEQVYSVNGGYEAWANNERKTIIRKSS